MRSSPLLVKIVGLSCADKISLGLSLVTFFPLGEPAEALTPIEIIAVLYDLTVVRALLTGGLWGQSQRVCFE